MENPFSTDALLPNASTYPVVKGGPGSGRHKEPYSIEADSEASLYRHAVGGRMPTPYVRTVENPNGLVDYYEFSDETGNFKYYGKPRIEPDYNAYSMTPDGDVWLEEYPVVIGVSGSSYWEPDDEYATEVNLNFSLPDEINDIMTKLANDGKSETTGIYSVQTNSLIEGFTNFSFSKSGKEEDAPKEFTPNSWVYGDNTKGERVPICTAAQALHFAYTGGVKQYSYPWIDVKAQEEAEARYQEDDSWEPPDDYGGFGH
jgi:hypothetical protein